MGTHVAVKELLCLSDRVKGGRKRQHRKAGAHGQEESDDSGRLVAVLFVDSCKGWRGANTPRQ